MIYSSYDFLLLLPPLVVWFYNLRSTMAQNWLILGASLVFLGWNSIWNILPAAIVVVVVWLWFWVDARWRTLGWQTSGALIGLLVLQLAYLKYRSFIAETFGISLSVSPALVGVIPLGISFYTFEAISAVIDVKRRPVKLAPMTWSLFILFLPHLVAGPIVRLRQLAPQFEQQRIFRFRNLSIGLNFFAIGFAKKLMADPIGRIIAPIWSAPFSASSAALLLALVGFSAQLYLDFSGYTDMGRGIARALGFRLPLNFRAPFFASTPAEFYQRWHVSLSNWIRIFVYDTLAVAVFRRIRERHWQNRALFAVVLLVMAIFGLWHGSAWHFVLFGIVQGFVIAGWAIATKGRSPRSWIGWLVSLAVLQISWLFSLVLFRAGSIKVALDFLVGLIHGGHWFAPQLLWCLAAMVAAIALQAIEYYACRRPVARILRWARGTVAGAILMLIYFAGTLAIKLLVDAKAIAATGSNIPAASFIYFRF